MKKRVIIAASFFVSCSLLFLSYAFAEEMKHGSIPRIKRNPFENAPYHPAGKEDEWVQKESIEDIANKMKVKGVIINDDGGTIALIGRSIVRPGDMIGEFTVHEITRSGVAVIHSGRLFTITIQ